MSGCCDLIWRTCLQEAVLDVDCRGTRGYLRDVESAMHCLTEHGVEAAMDDMMASLAARRGLAPCGYPQHEFHVSSSPIPKTLIPNPHEQHPLRRFITVYAARPCTASGEVVPLPFAQHPLL